ncbi:MAG: DUF1214 domain-containing protein [Halioglobus sp.]
MKKLVIAALLLTSLAATYVMGTFNASKTISIPDAQWTQNSEAAQAWREFSASLEAAGARVFERSEEQDERLEGLQFISQIASASLEMKLANGSTVHPKLTDWMSDYRKFLGDSPDAIYHTAQISPDFRYEIHGNRGDANYLGFMLYGKQLNGWNRAASNVSSQTLRFDDTGGFTLLLSKNAPEEPNPNWLELDDDIHMIMVRQYYHGRDGKAPATLSIRNLDAPAFIPLDDTQIAQGIRSATTFFNETLDGAIALTSMLAKAPNSFDPPTSYSADFGGVFYPTLDNEYYGGWFNLAEDEALIIEGSVPDAPYWALSLQNSWMQSMDYENHPVALNNKQIATENGRYRVILAHQKPPQGNWLSTAGKQQGLLSIRYQLSEDSETPTLKRVKFNALQ